MLTISVRTNRATLALKNLATPWQFTLTVNETMAHTGMETYDRCCAFWNATSLHFVRSNLTQAGQLGRVLVFCENCTSPV